jgi:hypothetical protein
VNERREAVALHLAALPFFCFLRVASWFDDWNEWKLTGSIRLPWQAAGREDVKLDEESANGERGAKDKSCAPVDSRTADLYGPTTLGVSLGFFFVSFSSGCCCCRHLATSWKFANVVIVEKKSEKIQIKFVGCALNVNVIMQIFLNF